MKKEAKSKLRRFTTEYVAPEDRMRILIEMDNNQVTIMWLTRRLMVRMVPELIKYLDEVVLTSTSSMEEQATGAPRTAARPRLSNNAQRQRQMYALGQIEQQKPVSPQTPDCVKREELITSLQVQLGHNGVLIGFLAKQDMVQQLPFAQDGLRQWLGVLHSKFRKAVWDDDVWPTWITAKGWDQGPDALRLN